MDLGDLLRGQGSRRDAEEPMYHNANPCNGLQEQGREMTVLAGIHRCRDMLLASGAKNKSGLVSETEQEWECLRYGVPAAEKDNRKTVTDYEE
jgi:hypothetical protein